MSNFKKDLSEHYNFFSKCSEYFLLKHKLSNLGNSRFASALDIYYLNELEKFYKSITPEDLNQRLAAVRDDLLRIGPRLRNQIRSEMGLVDSGTSFRDFKKENKGDEDFKLQREQTNQSVFNTRDGKAFFDKLFYLVIDGLKAKVRGIVAKLYPSRKMRISSDDVDEIAINAATKIFSGEGSTSLLDLVADFPAGMRSEDDYVRAITASITRLSLFDAIKETYGDPEQDSGMSLDTEIQGKDDSSTTFGEQQKSKAPSVEQQVESTMMPTQYLTILVERLKKDMVPQLEELENQLSVKQALSAKRFLSDEEMQQYMSATAKVNTLADTIAAALIGKFPEGQTKQNLIEVLDEQIPAIKKSFTIPGTEVKEEEAIPQMIEEPAQEEVLPGGKKPRKKKVIEDPQGMTDYLDYRERSSNYFDGMVPHIYGAMDMHPAGTEMAIAKSDTPRILRRRNDAIQYGEGISTKEQQDAVISGDIDSMRAAGVPDMTIFNRMLMQIVHELQADKIWESSGRPLPEATGSKDANDKYNRSLAALRTEFANSPEVLARIDTLIRPKGQAGGGLYQETFREFDKVRLSGELMKLLSDLGLTSFGQIYPAGTQIPEGQQGYTIDSTEVQNALNNIVSDESHYGQGRSWVGPQRKEVTHDQEAFKKELTAYLQWLINYANNGKPTPKNLPFWSASDPEAHGFTSPNVSMRGRQRLFKDPQTPESTQIKPEGMGEDDTPIQESKFTSTLSDGPYNAEEFFYQPHEKPHKHKRRFKITVK